MKRKTGRERRIKRNTVLLVIDYNSSLYTIKREQ